MIATRIPHIVCFWSCLLVGMHGLWANNLRFGDVRCDGKTLEVTVAWDNAWRLDTGPANHDAVWLFAKIKRNGQWEHLHLARDHNAHAVLEPDRIHLDLDPQGLGMLLQTLQLGSGNMPETHLQLALADPILEGEFDLAVFGIEMAYVPEGPFWVGDGASNDALYDATTGQPFLVTSEATIAAHQISAAGAHPPGGDLASNYPKGYGGFYLMKYEVSQAQYVDFLNLLTPAQQAQHTTVGTYMAGRPNTRNGIMLSFLDTAHRTWACNANVANAPFEDDDGQNRACNWLAWQDLSAYLDWAALRPITELEFEKACRGPIAPLPLEFAWGTDSVIDANTPLQDGTATEGVAETATPGAGLASHGYAGVQGPLRCGFGANASGDRLQAGAGYYGHTELSGNLWELCVSTVAEGLSFDGAYGDGELSADGAANVATWPTALGVGYKGGGWNSGVIPGFRDLAVSDRFYIGLAADTRRETTGGRGAR